MNELDRRTLLRRSGMAAAAAGTAWVAPLTFSTTASAGASCLLTGSYAWSSLGHDVAVATAPTAFATYAASPPYPALSITQTPSTIGSPTNGQAPQSGRTSTNQFGGFNSCYRLSMRCATAGIGWDAAFTFSTAVWNLQFNIYDIDLDAYIDLVYVTSSAAFTAVKTNPAVVNGTGTSGDPWTGTTLVDASSPDGNVRVTFAGPVTQFTVSFRSGNASNATQAVGIGDLSFCR